MKKILIILTVLVLGLIAIFYNNYDNNKVVLTNNSNQKINNSNTLTMMYETEYQSGEYQVSSDTSWPESGYTFNETLSKCENGSVLTWDDENKKVLLQSNTSDKCYVYFDKEPVTLASYIINNVYTGTDGENGLYLHDGTGSYTNADQEAGDNSYRYSGANPNNYVCFGSDEATCPADNLYRIIGVFDEKVKLIKNTSIGEYPWDTDEIDIESIYNVSNKNENYSIMKLNGILAAPDPSKSGSNNWSTSVLNYYLNNDKYLETINGVWPNIIENHIWQVGGGSSTYLYNSPVQTAYNHEVGTYTANTTYQAKIGVMYVSDYGYAASPENWKTNLFDYKNTTNINNNWLYLGDWEWTLSRHTSNSVGVFTINSSGGVGSSYDWVYYEYNVRPCFYLNSDVEYISGSGTQSDPYRIA